MNEVATPDTKRTETMLTNIASKGPRLPVCTVAPRQTITAGTKSNQNGLISFHFVTRSAAEITTPTPTTRPIPIGFRLHKVSLPATSGSPNTNRKLDVPTDRKRMGFRDNPIFCVTLRNADGATTSRKAMIIARNLVSPYEFNGVIRKPGRKDKNVNSTSIG